MTLAERLRRESAEALAVKFALAKTALAWSQTPFGRKRAIEEIEAIREEYARRGIANGEAA